MDFAGFCFYGGAKRKPLKGSWLSFAYKILNLRIWQLKADAKRRFLIDPFSSGLKGKFKVSGTVNKAFINP
jgi:hypothetical protein